MSQRIEAKSLTDLEPLRVSAELELPGGDVLIVPLRLLTYAAWNRIGREVKNPSPPLSGVDANKRPIHDLNDPTYQNAIAEAGEERNYRRLLAALDIPIPGATVEDKVKALRETVDAGVMRKLMDFLGGVIVQGEAAISGRQFHDAGTGGAADVPAVADS